MSAALVSATIRQILVWPSVLFVCAGCVSSPVMEFRGTAVNVDGTGRTEAARRELAVQSCGTPRMAYAGAGAMLLGFGEGKPSPPRPPKAGNLIVLRQELLNLAKHRHSGASVMLASTPPASVSSLAVPYLLIRQGLRYRSPRSSSAGL